VDLRTSVQTADAKLLGNRKERGQTRKVWKGVKCVMGEEETSVRSRERMVGGRKGPWVLVRKDDESRQLNPEKITRKKTEKA